MELWQTLALEPLEEQTHEAGLSSTLWSNQASNGAAMADGAGNSNLLFINGGILFDDAEESSVEERR
ncbi:hypothetical protein NDU88_006734 [Pleurodeles waltl]|uniref:Uncharacterized protein n=1 Tax=Pleurodeles waltl TaxID=8319 RepID=A0AAV7PJN9_PLEWA|nr:hypothetical protein NDU88_006734 [Pleurodeles waltl]